jgi:hypothetical protein
MFRSRMVAIGVATVWLVWGLIAIAFNQFQCGETKRTMKRAWDRRLSRNLGIPGGLPCASKKKSPRITQLSGGFRLCVCAVCLPGRIGGQGAGGVVRLVLCDERYAGKRALQSIGPN